LVLNWPRFVPRRRWRTSIGKKTLLYWHIGCSQTEQGWYEASVSIDSAYYISQADVQTIRNNSTDAAMTITTAGNGCCSPGTSTVSMSDTTVSN
jgi:hypothetical protein